MVVALQPDQVVQGASVDQGPSVQPEIKRQNIESILWICIDLPLQVLPGQASVPHHLVQGPLVQAPLLAHGPGPHPPPAPPKGPLAPPCQPKGPPAEPLPSPHAETAEAQAELEVH